MMIKFFRNIRQKLLSQGKTKNYLKYALGEIVLVMIGILLALQVNNWNENRKKNLAFEKLIVSFNKELRLNIDKSNGIIGTNYRRDSILQRILNHKLNREIIEEHPRILSLIGFYVSTIYYSEENLNLLLNQKEDFPSKYEPIIDDLDLLKEFINSQQKWENRLLDFVNEMDRYNNQNFEWLNKTDSVSVSQKIDYILNNPYYHNKLQSFISLQLNENVFDMNNVRLVSIRLLKEIEGIENGQIHQNAVEFIKSLGFSTFPKFNCTDSIVPLANVGSFRMYAGIYNTTKDSISLYITNESGEKTERQLTVMENGFIIIHNIPEGTIFIQEKDGECMAQYQNRRNSILLIE